MRHIIFEEADTYKAALLIKGAAFKKQDLLTHYVTPLLQHGLAQRDLIAFTAEYNAIGKAPAGFIKEQLLELLPVLASLSVQYVYVADANYFKVLVGQTKADPHFGYVLPCKIKGYEHLHIVLGVNHQALIYNPDIQAKLTLSLHTLAAHMQQTYQAPGTGIIHSAQYPEGVTAIAAALNQLHQYPRLTCDIEAFSLRFNEAGIGTIAFAWDQHNGVVFACDYKTHAGILGAEEAKEGYYGYQSDNKPVKRLLKQFFESYKGEITWHNGVYDIKLLIYELFMKPL